MGVAAKFAREELVASMAPKEVGELDVVASRVAKETVEELDVVTVMEAKEAGEVDVVANGVLKETAEELDVKEAGE